MVSGGHPLLDFINRRVDEPQSLFAVATLVVFCMLEFETSCTEVVEGVFHSRLVGHGCCRGEQ